MTWRKSTYSASGACVEVDTEWHTSSHCGHNACVEVAVGGRVAVRDTKNRDGVMLTFSPAAWQRFLAKVSA